MGAHDRSGALLPTLLALLVACGGCRVPKGHFIQVALSLECNRLPWRTGTGGHEGTCGECDPCPTRCPAKAEPCSNGAAHCGQTAARCAVPGRSGKGQGGGASPAAALVPVPGVHKPQYQLHALPVDDLFHPQAPETPAEPEPAPGDPSTAEPAESLPLPEEGTGSQPAPGAGTSQPLKATPGRPWTKQVSSLLFGPPKATETSQRAGPRRPEIGYETESWRKPSPAHKR